MIEKMNLLLLAPEKPMIEEQVEMVILPGEQGDFAVLSHHSSLIAVLRAGLVIIDEQNDLKRQIYIEGGFAQIQERECRLLVRDYFFVENFDLEEIKKLMDQKRKELENTQSKEEKKALERELHLAHIKMSLITQKIK